MVASDTVIVVAAAESRSPKYGVSARRLKT
jgi:hypothetical protein